MCLRGASWVMRPFAPTISLVLKQPKDVSRGQYYPHVTDREAKAQTRQVAFTRTTQLISNRASLEAMPLVPQPLLFSIQGVDAAKSLFEPRCAGGHINPSPLPRDPNPAAQWP